MGCLNHLNFTVATTNKFLFQLLCISLISALNPETSVQVVIIGCTLTKLFL